jgi:hypothetical protein
MKTLPRFTRPIRRLSFLLALFGLAVSTAPIHADSPGESGPSVTGSGVVNFEDHPDIWSYAGSFRTTVAVHERSDGQLVGTVHHRADNPVNLGLSFSITSKPTCWVVVDDGENGKKAWISSEITHVQVTGPDPDLAALLEGIFQSIGAIYTMVYDLGGNGDDVMHTEPFNVPCDADPEILAETVVRNGNFTIRLP